MTTGKTGFDHTDLCPQSDISVFLNMLSRFVIDFLPRSKCLIISWLKSPSAVILEPREIKSIIASRTGCHDLSFLNVEF